MSTLQVANISDGTDTVATGYVVNGSAKALCNYDQEAISLNRSLNVSSVTDTATGVAVVNMTSSFSAADYVVVGSVKDGGGRNDGAVLSASVEDTYTASAYQYYTSHGVVINDAQDGFSAFFGDLA